MFAAFKTSIFQPSVSKKQLKQSACASASVFFYLLLKDEKPDMRPEFISLLCANNYSYLNNGRYTQLRVGVCVCVCTYVRLHIEGQLAFSTFQAAFCDTKDEAQPDMIAFNVSHKSPRRMNTCVCAYLCIVSREEGRGVSAHTLGGTF